MMLSKESKGCKRKKNKGRKARIHTTLKTLKTSYDEIRLDEFLRIGIRISFVDFLTTYMNYPYTDAKRISKSYVKWEKKYGL